MGNTISSKSSSDNTSSKSSKSISSISDKSSSSISDKSSSKSSSSNSNSNSNSDCPLVGIIVVFSPGTKNIQMNDQFYLRRQCAIKFVDTLISNEYQIKIGINPPVPVIEIPSGNVTLNVIPQGETRGKTNIIGEQGEFDMTELLKYKANELNIDDNINIELSETLGQNPETKFFTGNILLHTDPGFVTTYMLTNNGGQIKLASVAVLLFDNFMVKNKKLVIPEICDFVTNQDPDDNIKRAGWMIGPLIRLCSHVRWSETDGIEYSKRIKLTSLEKAKKYWEGKWGFEKKEGYHALKVPESDSQIEEKQESLKSNIVNLEENEEQIIKYSQDVGDSQDFDNIINSSSAPSENDKQAAMDMWDLLFSNPESHNPTNKKRLKVSEGGSKRRKKTRRKKTRRRKTN